MVSTTIAVSRQLLQDARGRPRTVEHRHPQVHQHDVGPGGERESDRLLAVRGLAHDLEVVEQPEQGDEPVAHERLIVGDEDPDHEGRPAGFVAVTTNTPSRTPHVGRRRRAR